MSKKASPTLIGAFIVGGAALAVIGILLFGSGRLFQSASQFVLFFPGTVDGLSVGAPVKFKGVEIGAVTDIRIRLVAPEDAEDMVEGVRIPVFIEIDDDKLTSLGARTDLDEPGAIRTLIDAGLRGQLVTQSLVTGLLFVQLDFHPDTPVKLHLPPDEHPIEIPAVPTRFEQVQNAAAQLIQKLEDVDVERVIEAVVSALDGVNRLVNSPGLHESAAALPKTVATFEKAAEDLRELVATLDRRTAPLLEELAGAAKSGREALAAAEKTLSAVQQTLGPNAPLAVAVQRSLQDVSEAARAVHLLADYLERNPAALVRGREVPE